MKRVDGVPVIYLPFLHRRVLSELLSMLASIPILWRLHRMPGERTVLFYNRMPVHLAALLSARVMGFGTALDLEDGEIDVNSRSLRGMKARLLRWLFDTFCSAGALLACRTLEGATSLRPTECCYGTAEPVPNRADWSASPIVILLGGTVSRDTGAPLLAEAIGIMREESGPLSSQLRFEITGRGDCVSLFETLSKAPERPEVVVHGRTNDDEYRQILARTHVGLALRPNSGQLANTTFPSKVIHLASHCILVLTTDISDVREVLAAGALYLTVDNAEGLVEKLRWIVEHRERASALAIEGARRVSEVCVPDTVGAMLHALLFNVRRVQTNG
jgi:glycosyltransferase involved in cell wall biosynthesis